MLTLYVGNDNLIELVDLTNTATDIVDTGATVSVTITDRGGDAVAGQSFPVSMTHIATGLYQGIVSDALQLMPNRKYLVIVDAAGSGGEKGVWTIEAIARTRSE